MWTTEHSIETTTPRQDVWHAWTDVARWPEWSADIERIALDGPFAAGTAIAMTPRGQEVVHLRLAEVVEGRLFVDEADVGGTVVHTAHSIDDAGDGRLRIVYRLEATGPEAELIGPAVSADFGDTLAALVEYAAR